MRVGIVLVAGLLAATACTENNQGTATYAGLMAPVPGAPMTFVPEEASAAIFEDDDLGIEVIQVYAYEQSFGSGVFIQFPATIAANAGAYTLDPAADPAVVGWFATSDDGEEDDLRWQFALHSMTLVVVTPATAEGMPLAVATSGATFVFQNDRGVQNGAVTALVGAIDPPITAELEDDDLDECDLPD